MGRLVSGFGGSSPTGRGQAEPRPGGRPASPEPSEGTRSPCHTRCPACRPCHWGRPRPPSSPSPQKQQRRGRGRRRPLRTVRWSSSSGDSDGDSGGDSSSGSSKEDSEPEPEPEEAPEAQEGGRVLPSAWHSVPDVDLWIPARQGADRLWGGGAGGSAASPSPPAGSRGGSRAAGATARAPTERAGQAQAPSATHSAAVTDVGNPRSEHTPPSSSEGPADEVGPGAPPDRVWGGHAAAWQSPHWHSGTVGWPGVVPATFWVWGPDRPLTLRVFALARCRAGPRAAAP